MILINDYQLVLNYNFKYVQNNQKHWPVQNQFAMNLPFDKIV
jgi:hypothetical protein